MSRICGKDQLSYATSYGDSTRQLSVRAKSTKDNPGTLPISAYGRRTLLNNSREERKEERRNSSHYQISGPFLLGKLTQTPKRTASKVKTHVYASDPEDCLAFNYEFTGLVERRNMIGTVGDVQFTDEDFHIDLDQDQYEEFLERISGVEESEIDEEDLEQEHDPRVR